MPKTETASATRRSARIASASSAPVAKKEEAKPPPKATAKKASATKEKATTSKKETKSGGKATDSNTKAAKSKTNSKEEGVAEDKPKSKGSDKASSSKPPSANRGVLQLGSGLPKIVLQNEDGEDVDVSTLIGERGVVIFLYPRADTPGCTNQASGYRDLYSEFDALGYDVYGLSKDKPAAQLKWKTKKELQYHLLADPESKLIKRLGAFVEPKNTKRSHFIFEKGTGKLIDIDLGVKAAEDPKNALKFIKEHHK